MTVHGAGKSGAYDSGDSGAKFEHAAARGIDF
jgi:hypothetical protein